MQDRLLGSTGIFVSCLGLGTWAMGGDEWGPSEDQVSLDVLRGALASGITLIDTADVYGMGHAEELVAEAIPVDSPVIIVTKGGWDIYSEPRVVGGSRRRYERDYLEVAVAGSCRRLKRRRLDVYLLHNPTRDDLASSGAMATVRDFQARGWVRWVGASVGSEDDARAALQAGVEVLEVPLNAVRTWAARVLADAHGRGVAVIAREPFERGLLTGKYGDHATFPPGDHRAGKGAAWLGAAQEPLARLREIAGARGAAVYEVALAYPLAYPGVSCVIAGARSVDQLGANVAASALRLSPAERDLIETGDRAGAS